MIDRRELAAIFVGGALGALLRTAAVEGLGDGFGEGAPGWPWATFAANVAGALALGYLATHLHERPPLSSYRHPLLTTGLCGALTTFSAMQVELLSMLDAGAYGLAAAYLSGSLLAGIAGVHLASAAARRLGTRA